MPIQFITLIACSVLCLMEASFAPASDLAFNMSQGLIIHAPTAVAVTSSVAETGSHVRQVATLEDFKCWVCLVPGLFFFNFLILLYHHTAPPKYGECVIKCVEHLNQYLDETWYHTGLAIAQCG